MRILVTGSVLGVLTAGSVVLAPTSRAEDKKYGPPKLVWEKTFEKNILAVGVDEERFAQAKEDFSSSLKWILFTSGELRCFDKGGKLMSEPVGGFVSRRRVSPNGKYFFGFREQKKSAIYTLYNWGGERIWETDQFVSRPLVWNDGSAVSRLETVGHVSFFDTQIPAWGAKFFDAKGRVANTYRFPEMHYRWGDSHGYSMSNNFFAMVRLSPKMEFELYVFEKNGNLLWKEERIRRRFINQGNTSGAHTFGGVTVSDRGEVLFLFDSGAKYGTQVFIYDEKGELRDTLLLYPTGSLGSLRAEDRLAFVSTWFNPEIPSHFLCYELENLKVKFDLQEEEGQFFGNSGVDSRSGLLAVAVHRQRRGAGGLVKIFGLDGDYKTEVAVETRDRHFWFKLLNRALVVADNNGLKVYALEGGE